jgi:hypothetical protein
MNSHSQPELVSARQSPERVLHGASIHAQPQRSSRRSLPMAVAGITVFLAAQSMAATKPSASPASNPSSTSTSQTYTIDAGALLQASTVTASAAPGDIQVSVVNLLPATTTTYTVTIDILSVQALPDVLPSPGGTSTVGGTPTCAELIAVGNSRLNSQTTEQGVAQVGLYFNSLLTSTDPTDPKCSAASDKPLAEAAIAAFQSATTTTLVNKITLKQGQKAVLTVVREAGKNSQGIVIASKEIGKYTITTASPTSQWLILYGANFIDSRDQVFYSKTNTGTNPLTYTITPETNRAKWQFSPSVSFMWLPAENFLCDKEHRFSGCAARALAWRSETSDTFGGLTAGLGVSTSNSTSNPVAVFLGYAVGWGYNIALTAGIAVHQEQRLLGQYNSGQIVSENLTSSSLSQNVYAARFYAGILFRFGSNPFGSKAASAQQTQSSKTTPPAGQ